MTATLRIRVSIAAALLVSACAAPSPRVDARFGQSVRATMASQVAQPSAARNPDPVRGIDGRAAHAAQERYEHSYGKADGAPSAPLVGSK